VKTDVNNKIVQTGSANSLSSCRSIHAASDVNSSVQVFMLLAFSRIHAICRPCLISSIILYSARRQVIHYCNEKCLSEDVQY